MEGCAIHPGEGRPEGLPIQYLQRHLVTTLDTHGGAENTEAPKTVYRAIVKHRIVAIAHLLVRATTRIRSLSTAVILDVNTEHGFVIAVEYDKEDDGFEAP